ncbi:MAG: hypothetical protein AB1817_03890 [Chloroflexota bacterium]
MTFNPDNTRLLIAYSFAQPDVPGELVQIRTLDWQLVSSVSLARLTPGLTRFTAKTDWILSAIPKACTGREFAKETCWDIRGWDTTSGQPVDVLNRPDTDLYDLVISGNGQWLLQIASLSSLTNFDPQPHGMSFSAGYFPDEDRRREFVAGALSKQGDLVVLGIKDETRGGKFIAGWVKLLRWNGKTLEETGWNDGQWHISPDLTANGAKVDNVPLRLTFDPTDRWLGAQTTNSIYLFDIPNMGRLRGSVKFGTARQGVLGFNSAGSLLAGGHLQGLKVLSILGLKTVLERSDSEVTAVAFSHDGCLLAWGDAEGTVHIINAPRP